jgi:hypothetical protein
LISKQKKVEVQEKKSSRRLTYRAENILILSSWLVDSLDNCDILTQNTSESEGILPRGFTFGAVEKRCNWY